MGNKNLTAAKKAKNDEFYTQLCDVQDEMEAYINYNADVFRNKKILCPCDSEESAFWNYFYDNFKRLGLKKLIASHYSTTDPTYVLEYDGITITKHMLNGDGDFRSEEVTKLRDEADIIVTNPAFSLFREFLAWIIEAKKQFSIIGNQNAITYKEVFPLIKNNEIWLGNGFRGGNAFFKTPDDGRIYADGVYNQTTQLVKFRNCLWFTNIDHGKRHEPMRLMTMADNLKYNKKLIKKLPKDENGKPYYPKYDNFDALEVPLTEAIPSDYEPCWFKCPHADKCVFARTEGKKDEALCESQCSGNIGVPITAIEKMSNQYEIVGSDYELAEPIIEENGAIKKDRFYLSERVNRQVKVGDNPEHNTTQHNTTQHNTTQHNTTQHNTTQHNTTETVCANCHSQAITSVELSSESPSQHSDESMFQNTELLALQTQQGGLENSRVIQSLINKEFITGFLFKKCRGLIGCPITMLDQYNPSCYEIIDINPHFFYMKLSGEFRQLKIHGQKDPYARIIIQKRRKS